MTEKNICFLYITIDTTDTLDTIDTINNSEKSHHISMDVNVEKKKLYCYERLTSIDYELGHMENNEYKIDKKSKQILVKPRCAHFKISNDLALEKGIDPEKILIKLLNQLKKINIIICNGARFTLNSILAEAIRYNIQLDLNKIMIIDLNSNNQISNAKSIKDTFFDVIKKN